MIEFLVGCAESFVGLMVIILVLGFVAIGIVFLLGVVFVLASIPIMVFVEDPNYRVRPERVFFLIALAVGLFLIHWWLIPIALAVMFSVWWIMQG